MQYEDGDTEELLVSELKRKKLLQPAGPQDRTDFAELDRLYAAAKLQWAKGTVSGRLHQLASCLACAYHSSSAVRQCDSKFTTTPSETCVQLGRACYQPLSALLCFM